LFASYGGKVASAADFKRSGIEYDHKLAERILITDATLKAYRDFDGVHQGTTLTLA
jgi:hypothetical protein